jgi:hypothetical protein
MCQVGLFAFAAIGLMPLKLSSCISCLGKTYRSIEVGLEEVEGFRRGRRSSELA